MIATPGTVLEGSAGSGVARLSVSQLSKSFGGIHALRAVSFDIAPGEIHALLGENGAGKSTLVKIVSGLHVADHGEVFLDGVPRLFRTPMEARRAGVVAVYQDPKLFPHLDVTENIFMGVQPLHRLGTIDRRRMYDRSAELLCDLEAGLSPTAMVAGLSIGEMQFVEFARAMAEGVDRLRAGDQVPALLGEDAGQLRVAGGTTRRDPMALPLTQVDLAEVVTDDRLDLVLGDDRGRGLDRAPHRAEVDGGDGLASETPTGCLRLFVAARVEPRVASTVDKTVGSGRVAGAVADEHDLASTGRSGERPLEIDLHAPIIENAVPFRD